MKKFPVFNLLSRWNFWRKSKKNYVEMQKEEMEEDCWLFCFRDANRKEHYDYAQAIYLFCCWIACIGERFFFIAWILELSGDLGWKSALRSVNLALYSANSAFYSANSALHSENSALHSENSPLYKPNSALYSANSAIYSIN